MGGYISSETAQKNTPIGFGGRVKHLVTSNWRGVIGFVLGLVFLPPFDNNPDTPYIQARSIWLMLIFYFIFQPVPPPITGILPVILLPLCNIVGSKRLCNLYFDDNVCHFILGSMMLLLLNNSGFDRRFLLTFMCLGKKWQPMRFMLFTSIGAYLMSMFSNRLIVMNTLMELVAKPLQDRVDAMSIGKAEPNYKLMKNMMICCISCACSIGSFASIHSSITTMLFRSAWHGGWAKMEFPDIFNYFQYMFFAIPLSIVCLLATVGFFCLLFKIQFKKTPIPESTCSIMRDAFVAHKNKLSPISGHEQQSVLFTVLFHLALVFRYSYMLGGGWSSFRIVDQTSNIPFIRDCTVSAAFVIILCILPKDLQFLKIITAKKKSEMPLAKSPSAIIFWKFIDMNVNYGYIFLFGCASCVDVMLQATRYNAQLADYYSSVISKLGFELTLLIILVIAAILANLTIGPAAVVILVPFVKAVGSIIHNHPWPSQHYLGALGVGICASFGFMSSHKYTPNYFAKTVGNTKTIDMIKLGFIPVVINVILTWLFVMFFAPAVFDPEDAGIHAVFTP